ncbi:MAG: RNA polymerase sigma factor [Myxococcota bacterium]
MPTPPAIAADTRPRPITYAALVDAWSAPVLRWCARLGGPRIDAEDAAQDVFLRVLRNLATLRDPQTLPAWLFAITRRVVIDHRRRAWLRRWVPGVVPDVADPRRTDDGDLARVVHTVLDGLPNDLREILVLCDLEERTAEEVSGLVGVPIGTVRSRLRRARERFGADALRRGLVPEETR